MFRVLRFCLWITGPDIVGERMAMGTRDSLQAGDLSHRIQIEAPVRTTDSLGQVTRHYRLLATVWAKAEPLSTKAVLEAGQSQAQSLWQFVIRDRKDLKLSTEHRIVFQGATMSISALVKPIAGLPWIRITAGEGGSVD